MSIKQFGFSRRFSTGLAVGTFTKKVRKHLEDGIFAVGLFLDFTKAFDTLNCCTLLHKLRTHGFERDFLFNPDAPT